MVKRGKKDNPKTPAEQAFHLNYAHRHAGSTDDAAADQM